MLWSHREGEKTQAQDHLREASKKIWMIVPTNKGWLLKYQWPLKVPTSYMYGTKNCFNIQCFFFLTLPITSPASAEITTIVQSIKWVKNLLEVPLTEAQVSLLAHGPNFTVASRSHPYGEYITALEQACLNLEPHNAEELRAEIRGALRHAHNPRMNITKEEAQALAELRKDHSRVIPTADKGISLAVMDRIEYNSKSQKLLEDGRTYKEIKTTPQISWRTSLSTC